MKLLISTTVISMTPLIMASIDDYAGTFSNLIFIKEELKAIDSI